MAGQIDIEVRTAVNDIRRTIYGQGISIILLKENGDVRKYDEGPEIDDDFMVSFDKTGNATLLIVTSAFDSFLGEATHMAFQEWVFAFSEPAKPGLGPVNMRKITCRPEGHRYVYEP